VHDQVEQMLAAHQSSAGAELISLQGSAALVRSELDATELRTQQLQRTIALIEASRKSRHELSDQIQAVWLSMDRQPVPVLSLHGLRPRSLSAIDETLGSIVRLGQALSSAASAVRRFELEGRLGVLRGQLDQAEAELGRLEAEAAGAARRHTESDSLLKAVRESSVEVVASSLRLVNPVFSQVYRRLSPHPTFTDLGLEHDLYRQKGRSLPVVTDPTAAISANPGVVCSVGQLNVVALSYFLALGITSGTDPLGLVVMDDPLQSLDDVNALGFADFCRQLKRQRQVLLTTHDRRFGSLLRRKLAPRESSETCVFVSFDGWDRRGPSITVERMDGSEPQLLLA
jgi:DNA repair exonuclease SbcCD ATPase subunit